MSDNEKLLILIEQINESMDTICILFSDIESCELSVEGKYEKMNLLREEYAYCRRVISLIEILINHSDIGT